MKEGAVFENFGIDPEVKIGAGTVLRGGCDIRGDTVIGENCEIVCSVIDGAKIGDNVTIGPWAYIRPGCEIADGAKIGSFTELKNAKIGRGAKIPHLSYVGDAEVGADVNVGCGAITANFDGKEKHKTVIGEGAFIGSNSVMIAPVNVGAGAFVAANSWVTGDIPENAFAIARERNVTVKPGRTITIKGD